MSYRQAHALWRLRGLYNAVTARRTEWGDNPRAGFTEPTSSHVRQRSGV